jgi:immunity protein, SdpI family
MKITWRTEWPLWLLLVAMFTVAALNWRVVPDQMPVHWGLSGQPDRWGGRFEGLLLLPLVGVAVYLVLLAAPRIDPGRANYASFAEAYGAVRLVVLVAMLAIQVMMVLAARGRAVDMGAWVPLIVGGLFTVLGSLFGKLRPNWFIGIRTPWTLSSKQSWDRTHRVGGRLFILFGLLLMSLALSRPAWLVIAVFGVIAAGVIGLVVYSYVVWRDDPEKTAPAGTAPAGE